MVHIRLATPNEYADVGALTEAACAMGFVRSPDRDWQPMPGLWLRGFSLSL
jgi:hypothetical protein